METISSEVVEKTWKKMGRMSPLKIPQMIYRMKKEQPVIVAYLLAIGSALFNQDEMELLLYLGVVIWQMMSQGNRPLTKIAEDVLDEMERLNMKMVEYLEDELEAGFMDATKQMIGDYPQPEVLRYLIEALMEEQGEGCVIRDEKKGMMMLYLKTVVDCFDSE